MLRMTHAHFPWHVQYFRDLYDGICSQAKKNIRAFYIKHIKTYQDINFTEILWVPLEDVCTQISWLPMISSSEGSLYADPVCKGSWCTDTLSSPKGRTNPVSSFQGSLCRDPVSSLHGSLYRDLSDLVKRILVQSLEIFWILLKGSGSLYKECVTSWTGSQYRSLMISFI